MKNRKILSAVITAAIVAGSVMPSYTVFAESGEGSQAVTQAELSLKEPESINLPGYTTQKDGNTTIYSATLNASALQNLPFSGVDADAGRTEAGYYCGFKVLKPEGLAADYNGNKPKYRKIFAYFDKGATTETILASDKWGNGSGTYDGDGSYMGCWNNWLFSFLKKCKNEELELVYGLEFDWGNDVKQTVLLIADPSGMDFDEFYYEDHTCTTYKENECETCGRVVIPTATFTAFADAAVAAGEDCPEVTVEADVKYTATTTWKLDTAAATKFNKSGTYTATVKLEPKTEKFSITDYAAPTGWTAVAGQVGTFTKDFEIEIPTYTITNSTTDTNGTVTIKDAEGTPVTKAAEGDVITITATGNEGYVLDTLKVNGTAVTAEEDGSYEYTMTAANVTVVATFKEETVAVTKVTLNKTELSLAVDETATLTATVEPENATDKTITWGSDDETVATVVNGVVTALKAGTANITATNGDKIATCKVTVTAAEEETDVTVTLNKETLTLLKGGSETLTATTTPADTEVTWSSSDPTVATVVGGRINAVARGKVTITAKCGDAEATCEVTVNEEQKLTVPETPSKPAEVIKDDAEEEGKYNENDVFVITKEEAEAAKSVTITVTTSDGKTYTQDVTQCYKTVTHTKKDGTTDTLSAGDNFMLAVTVTGIPDDVEVTVTVTVNK